MPQSKNRSFTNKKQSNFIFFFSLPFQYNNGSIPSIFLLSQTPNRSLTSSIPLVSFFFFFSFFFQQKENISTKRKKKETRWGFSLNSLHAVARPCSARRSQPFRRWRRRDRLFRRRRRKRPFLFAAPAARSRGRARPSGGRPSGRYRRTARHCRKRVPGKTRRRPPGATRRRGAPPRFATAVTVTVTGQWNWFWFNRNSIPTVKT